MLATPFHGPGLALDLDSLRREVELFVSVPADGLVVLGVFGEGISLDTSEQATVIAAVAEHAAGTPLVVGVSSLGTAVALEQGRTAVAAAGEHLAALMVQANTADPGVLADHLEAVHTATGAGIVLQDYPVASGVRIGPDTILRVLQRCPFVVAVKSEAPPTAAAIARLCAETDVPVFGGLGGVGLLDELAAGAAGAMTGFSHPEALRATLDAFAAHGFAAAREAFAPWLPLVNFEAQPGIGLALRKEVLRRRGVLDDAAVRPPAPRAPEVLLDLLAQQLAALPPIPPTDRSDRTP